MYRRLYLIGIVAYLGLLVVAITFYKERIIISDTAATLFNIVKNRSYSIQLSRLSAVFTESFPLAGVRAGLSWNSIMVSYSISFVVFYFLCYLACGLLFKKYAYGLVILLLNILIVSDSFYWIISELPQGIAFMVVIFAALDHSRKGTHHFSSVSLFAIAVILLSFFHPLLFIPLLYCAAFFITAPKTIATPKVYYLMIVIFFAAVVIKTLAFHTEYDKHSVSGLKNFITLFPNYFTLYANKKFLADCLTKFYWIPVFFIAITALYAVNRQWQKMALFICFFMGYLLLVNVSYPSKVTPAFYIENLYLPLSIFLALPFVFDVLPVLERKKVALPIMILIAATGIVRICLVSSVYSARLSYERKYLDKYGDKKVIAKAAESDNKALQIIWGTPYELLLLSESERLRPASIIIDDTPQYRYWAPFVKNALIVNWDVYPYSKLDQKYFHFTDTVSGYTILE